MLPPDLAGARFFAPATFVAPALVFVTAAFRDFEAARALDFDRTTLAISNPLLTGVTARLRDVVVVRNVQNSCGVP